MVSFSKYIISSIVGLLIQHNSNGVFGFGVQCGLKPAADSYSSASGYDYNNVSSLAITETDTQSHANIRVALFGDQGLTDGSKKVLEMIRDFNADFAIHLGDFDYEDNPHKFSKQIKKVLGKKFPYFAAIGNHDILRWQDYADKLMKRLRRSGDQKHCKGEFGVNMVCNFKGIVFVLSGVGTMGSDHAEFIEAAFRANPGKWKICAWHKNQHNFQLGTKNDETGYAVYETCRKYGAIIASGHEHNYARTHLMSNFTSATVRSTKSPLKIGPGKTFAFVAGTGGHGIRAWSEKSKSNPWWAVTAAANNGLNFGAMMCTFYINGRQDQSHCRFQDIDGKIWDDFLIERDLLVEDGNNEPVYETRMIETTLSHYESAVETNSVNNYEFLYLSNSHVSTGTTTDQDQQHPLTTNSDNWKLNLVFENNKFAIMKTINTAYLQFLGADAMGDAEIIIRGINHGTGEPTSAFAVWKTKVDEEESEKGSVWLTPNLKDIVTELLQESKSNNDNDNTLIFQLESHQMNGIRKVYGTKNKCLAPVLSIQH